MQKLIAYDHLEGDPGLDGGLNGTLFTDILNMVCSSVDNSSPDRYAPFCTGNWFLFLQKFGFSGFGIWYNGFQYHSSSFEGASYSCCINQVQRYVVRLKSLLFAYFTHIKSIMFFCVSWFSVHQEMKMGKVTFCDAHHIDTCFQCCLSELLLGCLCLVFPTSSRFIGGNVQGTKILLPKACICSSSTLVSSRSCHMKFPCSCFKSYILYTIRSLMT